VKRRVTRDKIIATLKETAPASRLLSSRACGIPAQFEMRRSIEPRFAKRITDDSIEVF
jgi:hypothetical protein